MVKLVTDPIFRPPQEKDAIQLHATQGCSYNRCKFCYVFKRSHFQAAPMRQIKQGLLGQVPLLGTAAPVYLSGGNAFTLPFERLREIALLVREHAPDCPRISMYTRIEDIARKSDDELAELAALGINHLYPGTESGDNEALDAMDKGSTVEEALCQLKRLERAGIAYTASYILGLAGKGRGERSARLTADFFNQLHPERISTTGLTVFEQAPLHQAVEQGAFLEADEREKVEELLLFLRLLTTHTIVDSSHYLNMVNFTARIPEEQAAIIREVEEFLGEISDEQIRENYKRDTFRFI